MYKLPYFTETDTKKVIQFMNENYFAVVTTMGNEYPVATHLPLEIIQKNNKLYFKGHLMRNTDHHNSLIKNPKVLVIFNGPHSYVSASWYQIPNVASTWNYMTVHAKGQIVFGDEDDTLEAVRRITDMHEKESSTAAFKNLPSEYVSRLLKAIVSFEIEVDSFDNVFKLSQNHDLQTQKNIIEHLQETEKEGAVMIAKEMLSRLEK